MLSTSTISRFELQAAHHPDALAVVHQSTQLTYGQLNRRANRLGHRLTATGLGPETLVAIALPRCVDLIIAMLAVLKAGGAYVPLDPCYPAARLTYMLDDSRAALLLTQSGLITHDRATICLDTEAGDLASRPADNLPDRARPHHLAYVIYTSGSTGTPKGVMIERGALDQFVPAIADAYGIHAQDRVLQFASPSFDVSIEEIFPCLCRGATLVLRDEDMLNTVPTFVRRSGELGVTVWDLPTAYWHLIATALSHGQITLPAALRLVVIGGEQANAEHVRQWQDAVGLQPQLINAYGPTETTVEASLYPVRTVLATNEQLPIGRPLADAQFHILDGQRQPVAAGSAGELYIGGRSLARGYLNSPDLTAAKFIPHPFDRRPGARLYKTGDLVRLRPDGEFEYLGRIDEQVKVQGFRIELGEIEAVLATHPLVADVAVIARDDPPGEKRLVAYVVAGPNLKNATSTLQAFLHDRLPHYLVPKTIVVLEALPRTPNDKVDRRALPAPSGARPDLAEAYLAPGTSTQQTLAAIWEEALGVAPIGVRDDFFNLGGHSLIAAQILWGVQKAFGFEVTFRDLLENSTLEAFAGVVDRRQQGAANQWPVVLEPVPRDGPLPVSFAQERVHFIEALSPAMTAYQFQESLRFTGHLEVAVLERTLSEIIARHEIYRTTFETGDGTLIQRIAPPYSVTLPVVDLRSTPVAQRESQLDRRRHAFVLRPFDIRQLPLLRWQLIRLSDTEHELVHVEHHMVHDGWSFNVFLRELLAIYRAFSQGRPTPLPEPPPQFADFAAWQRRWAHSDAARAQLDYWIRTLAGSPPLLELPYDRPRPPEQRFHGGMERMELPLDLCQRLRAFGAQEKVTLFMTMYTAFLVLIHRYSRQDDLCIGSGVANRRMQAIADMIGMVVNNVVLRNNLSGDPSFYTLLHQVRQVTLDAYSNEDLPFDQVVEALKPVRQLSYNPLFQVMFSFHDAQLPDLAQLPGLTVTQHECVTNHSAKFDLDVVAIPRAEQRLAQHHGDRPASLLTDGITLVWEYNADLFDALTIRRMMDEYRVVLERALIAPNCPVSALDLLTPAQRQLLLYDWNQTRTGYADDRRCIHALFEAQARLTPDRIAVIDGKQQLSYRDLDRRANQLAHHLRGLQVGPEVLVGMSVERSLDMLVCLFGILKAGGAYLPLDPTYPSERLSYMLEDSQAPVLVTTSSQAVIATRHEVKRVCIDTDWDLIARHSTDQPEVPVGARHLAYVIYTSGSTGRPKGVMLEHGNVVNMAQAAIDIYGITADDRILQFASMSFDAAAEEIYPCLSTGGRLILRPADLLDSFSRMVDFTCEQALTVWDFPTAYWHVLCHELVTAKIALPKSLRLVIVGGERALPERIRQWLDHTGTTPKLVNGYGPTESTVVATVCDLTVPGILLEGREAPIGRPLANLTAYVLDSRGQPVPVGVPGELHLGGRGIARGYLNQAELTADKFIADPFDDRPGARLYKTGDLVRYRPDGHLEYIGRTDSQVKIRGLRIELGEIESAINQYPGIGQAVVVAREDVPGTKRLVAYLSASAASGRDTERLRQYLTEKLPVYMVPTAFVMLDALPMTVSGKIDTKALPLPEPAGADDKHSAPRTAIEEALVAIWSRILRLDHIGIHDNFFELGGDSIISIQMISQANQVGLRFTAKQLFQNQTIAQLAGVVSTDAGRRVLANQDCVCGDAPLTPIQHWFLSQPLPQPHYFNQSALLELPADVDAGMLERCLHRLVEHHDAWRLRFINDGDDWRQTHATPAESLVFNTVEVPPGTVEDQLSFIRTVDADVQGSLDLATGPVVQAVLFAGDRVSPSYLLLVAHHLVIDTVSWRILLEDLTTIYRQLERNETVQLPAKTTSFQDWSERLLAHAGSAAVLDELDYWVPPVALPSPGLPLDGGDPAAGNSIGSIGYVTRLLTETETRALLQEVPAAYNTQINDVLLTALAQSIQRWTGQTVLRVDLEGHGREDLFDDIDLSRTVGWLTAMYPVVLTVHGAAPGEVLKSIKEQLRAVPSRGMGYGMLRYLSRDSAVRTRMATAPQVQVSFNYLGRFDQVTAAGQGFLRMSEWKAEGSREGERSHVLALSGLVSEQRLEMRWEYSTNLHRPETIEQLANGYMRALRDIITHCQASAAKSYTPSDFSATTLSQKNLDKLMSKVQRRS